MNALTQAVLKATPEVENITAIDIGTTKIVALVGTKDRHGKIQILGKGTQPTPQNTVKRGVVLNIEQASLMIKEAVKKAEEQSGVKFTNAFVGIAGQHIKSRKESHSKLISSADKEITQAVLDEMRDDLENLSLEPGHEIIHIIPQQYKVDNENGVTNPCGMYANKIAGNYNVIVGETESVKNIIKCFDRIGIKINDLFLEPLASSKSVLTDEEREAGVALVDIGGGTTDVAVYYDNILKHTAVIPLGGNIVTSDIHKGCQILYRYAEKVKVDYGDAISDIAPDNKVVSIPGINGRKKKEIPLKVLSKIIQARMEEIIEFVDYELRNSGVKNQLGAGIVITGGGSLLRQLVQLFIFKTGLEVKKASPGQYLSSDYKLVSSPVYSTAVGLLMLGYDNAHKIVPGEPEQKPEQEQAEEPEVQRENEQDIQRGIGGFLDRIRKAVDGILTENDSEIDES